MLHTRQVTPPRARFVPTMAQFALRRGAPLVYDAFSDDDDTGITSHTPDRAPAGSAWAKELGEHWIQSNRAESHAGTSFAVIDAGQADCTVSAIIDIGQISGATAYKHGFAVRKGLDMVHTWYVYQENIADELRIVEYNGSQTIRAASACALSDNTDYLLTVVCSGTTIRAHLNAADAEYNSATYNQSETEHGLYTQRVGSITHEPNFDYFKVTK